MKKLFVLLVALAALFAIACIEKPEEPVCPEGQITVTPAIWNEGYTTPGHYESRTWVDPVVEYTCPIVEWTYGSHHVHVPYEKSQDPTKCHRPSDADLKNIYGIDGKERNEFKDDNKEWKDAIEREVTPGYYTEWVDSEKCNTHQHKTCRFIEGTYVEGYWTPPVCEEVPPPDVCEDPLALNYKQEGECEYPPPEVCQYNPQLLASDPLCVPPKTCELVRQDYGLGELWGPDGQYATMYIYPDKYGNLPIGIGVQRQLCVLGWEAVRSGYFGFVYRDSCTGDYVWKGVDVTPRPDVLKHGVCARDGACIQ